jgi:gliding motility-associated lipoprotein GldH
MFISLVACEQDVIFHQSQDVKDPWKYREELSFEYEISDTMPAYDMTIDIEHLPTFAYENLYLNTTTIFPDGKSTTYPISFQLANEKGEWSGDCSGENCNMSIEMSSGAFFKTTGKYRLVFEQYSREDNLGGIRSIAITVKKTKK